MTDGIYVTIMERERRMFTHVPNLQFVAGFSWGSYKYDLAGGDLWLGWWEPVSGGL